MSNFKGWEIFIILVLLLVLFGAKRLPDAARGLGRSLRIFKAETKGLRDDDEPDRSSASPSAPPAPRELPSADQSRPVTQQPAEHETQER